MIYVPKCEQTSHKDLTWHIVQMCNIYHSAKWHNGIYNNISVLKRMIDNYEDITSELRINDGTQ